MFNFKINDHLISIKNEKFLQYIRSSSNSKYDFIKTELYKVIDIFKINGFDYVEIESLVNETKEIESVQYFVLAERYTHNTNFYNKLKEIENE